MKLTKHQQKIMDAFVFGSYFWKHKKLMDSTIDAILATGETKEIKIVGKYMTGWYVVYKTFEE